MRDHLQIDPPPYFIWIPSPGAMDPPLNKKAYIVYVDM